MTGRPADPGLDADLATLRRYVFNDKALAALARVEAELSRLREQRDECERQFQAKVGEVIEQMNRTDAAEARCARLQQALAGLESAVRILDVMLREPAAEGLMSAEDYRSYVQGAWLGVDEAAEKARDALAGPDTPADSQEPCLLHVGCRATVHLDECPLADSQPEEMTT